MVTLVILGVGLSVGIARAFKYKKGNKKSKKLQYYNYSKYEVKYNRINKAISERSKGLF